MQCDIASRINPCVTDKHILDINRLAPQSHHQDAAGIPSPKDDATRRNTARQLLRQSNRHPTLRVICGWWSTAKEPVFWPVPLPLLRALRFLEEYHVVPRPEAELPRESFRHARKILRDARERLPHVDVLSASARTPSALAIARAVINGWL
jgi:hypothetical protein